MMGEQQHKSILEDATIESRFAACGIRHRALELSGHYLSNRDFHNLHGDIVRIGCDLDLVPLEIDCEQSTKTIQDSSVNSYFVFMHPETGAEVAYELAQNQGNGRIILRNGAKVAYGPRRGDYYIVSRNNQGGSEFFYNTRGRLEGVCEYSRHSISGYFTTDVFYFDRQTVEIKRRECLAGDNETPPIMFLRSL